MAGVIPPNPEPIGRAALTAVLPALLIILGIVCAVFSVCLGTRTIISGEKLFFTFLLLSFAGCYILYANLDFFERVYSVKRVKKRNLLAISMVTFGTIPICFFLLVNKVFSGKQEYSSTVKIEEKQTVRRKIQAGLYDDRVATSFTFEEEHFSEDFMPSTATDDAEYLVVRYRHGLFGCDVITGFELK